MSHAVGSSCCSAVEDPDAFVTFVNLYDVADFPEFVSNVTDSRSSIIGIFVFYSLPYVTFHDRRIIFQICA